MSDNMTDEERDVAEFLKLRGKSLPTPEAAPKAKRTPKKVIEDTEEPLQSVQIPLDSLVRVRRVCYNTPRRLPTGTVGKVIKVYDDPADWFTVSFPYPSASDPFVINLHRNDLEPQ